MIKTVQVIDVHDWDALVEKTYGKPYNFQQQSGCQERGYFPITVPDDSFDYENDTVPEIVNGDEMGVSFEAWKTRDPRLWKDTSQSSRQLWWERNFYPDIQMVANDLYAQGLLPAGEYKINIDW